MGARLIVIGSVASKNKPQMRSANYDDMIKAFAPKRADETFGNSVLPWRSEADWPVANSHRCVYRKLNSGILVVKTAEERYGCDGAEPLNCAMERGILVQGSMGPRLIIITGVSSNDLQQVLLAQDDNMIQALTSDRSDQPFSNPILPR
jgi:hypothetical protein